MNTFTVENYMRVKIEEIVNPFNMDIHSLFSIGYRKNKKRAFLFVSKLIGKHIAVNPNIPLISSSLLAYSFSMAAEGCKYDGLEVLSKAIEDEGYVAEAVKYMKQNPIRSELPTLFIGFAETATALAHGVFAQFTGDCAFIHTTREDIVGLDSLLEFEEEHSHAMEHRFFSLYPGVFEKYNRIVMIDDELTTGKTVKNLAKAIVKKYGEKDFYVLSILDWRKDDSLERYNIKPVSLLKGSFEFENNMEPDVENEFQDCVCKKAIVRDEILLKSDFIVKFREKNYSKCYKNYHSLSGRFGLRKDMDELIKPLCKEYGELLADKRKEKDTLCIGYCEFMYIPCLIAANMGAGVKYHSLTQSPIYNLDKNYYPVKDKICFDDPWNENIKRYIYNIASGKYKEVFIISEGRISEKVQLLISEEMAKRGVEHIHYVSFDEIPKPPLLGSYSASDVLFLLKDVGKLIKEQDNATRERIIQNGGHYSEMLPIEYRPKEEYMRVFHNILEATKLKIVRAVAVVAELLLKQNGEKIVLVSLARAGTPIGILIKRYIKEKHGLDLPHYSISIIRDRGIDENAIKYILQNHPDSHMKFIDGWTGKGTITEVLREAASSFYEKYRVRLDDELAVLADPGHCSSLYGTREDFLIPSACLNSTVSGLVSRTVLRKDIIGPKDFHGVKFYREWADIDVSNLFIDTISDVFSDIVIDEEDLDIDKSVTFEGLNSVKRIQKEFGITNTNLVKPGVGETTRVLLRRMPWKVLVKDLCDPNLKHIFLLCEDKNVPVQIYEHMSYSCCGLIMGKGET